MLKNTDTYTEINRITREIYIEKFHGVAVKYMRLFMEKLWPKSNQKASEEFQKITALIGKLRFDKEIPDEKCLDAMIKEAEKKLPVSEETIAYGALTKEQFDAEIEKGMEDIKAGRVYSADEVETEILKYKKDVGFS